MRVREIAVSAVIGCVLFSLTNSARAATSGLANEYQPYMSVQISSESYYPNTNTFELKGRGTVCTQATISLSANHAEISELGGSPLMHGPGVAAIGPWDLPGSPTPTDATVDLNQIGQKWSDAKTFYVCGDDRKATSVQVRLGTYFFTPAADYTREVRLFSPDVQIPIHVSNTDCLPLLRDVSQQGWSKDGGAVTYLPILTWKPVSFASPTAEYASCTDASTAQIATVTGEGAAKGFVVVQDGSCDYARCTLTFAGRKYDLKNKSTRSKLSCSRVDYAPGIAGTDTIVRWVNAENAQVSDVTGNYSKSLCLPTPSKPGSYKLLVDRWSPTVTEKGRGWLFRCSSTSFGNHITVNCGWQFEGDEKYSQTEKTKSTVVVSSDGVTA